MLQKHSENKSKSAIKVLPANKKELRSRIKKGTAKKGDYIYHWETKVKQLIGKIVINDKAKYRVIASELHEKKGLWVNTLILI